MSRDPKAGDRPVDWSGCDHTHRSQPALNTTSVVGRPCPPVAWGEGKGAVRAPNDTVRPA